MLQNDVVTLYKNIYFHIKSVQKYRNYTECVPGLQVTLAAETLAVHLTVMTGRSVQLLPNIYHRYAPSGADCTHVCTSVVRRCMSGYDGRSVVQLSSLARAD